MIYPSLIFSADRMSVSVKCIGFEKSKINHCFRYSKFECNSKIVCFRQTYFFSTRGLMNYLFIKFMFVGRIFFFVVSLTGVINSNEKHKKRITFSNEHFTVVFDSIFTVRNSRKILRIFVGRTLYLIRPWKYTDRWIIVTVEYWNDNLACVSV